MDRLEWTLYISGAICCLLIAREDFRFREIRWLWFLLFGGLGVALGINKWGSAYPEIHYPGLLMVLIMIGLVVMYFRLRRKERVMDSFLGWGDVVMLLALVLWLEVQAFLFFYVAGLSLTVIYYGLMQYFKKLPKNHPIPLAGILALAFIIYWPVQNLLLKDIFY